MPCDSLEANRLEVNHATRAGRVIRRSSGIQGRRPFHHPPREFVGIGVNLRGDPIRAVAEGLRANFFQSPRTAPTSETDRRQRGSSRGRTPRPGPRPTDCAGHVRGGCAAQQRRRHAQGVVRHPPRTTARHKRIGTFDNPATRPLAATLRQLPPPSRIASP
jgi:muconolactone delta-isomerase